MSDWSLEGDFIRHPDGRQLPVRVAHLGGSAYQVWLSGELYRVEVASSGPQRAGAGAQSSGGDTLQASMPGSVLSIRAAVGDQVEAGQPLIVMESMKMELTLESPRAGKIAEIKVEPGQLVEMGATLLVLEKCSS